MKLNVNLLILALTFIVTPCCLPFEFMNRIPNQEFIGARPMAMGETFVAVADDINSIYWNPAGLPTLNNIGVNFMRANLFNSGIYNTYLAVSIPAFPKTSIGIDWMNLSFNDEELDFGINKFNFSLGYRHVDWISLGVNLKYMNMNMGLDHNNLGLFYGWGLDLGILCQPLQKLKLGLMVHDVTDTKLEHIKGSIYKHTMRVGAAYQPFSDLLIATDIDDRWHLGIEYWPFRKILASHAPFQLALRAGLQQDIYTNEAMTISFGMGLDVPIGKQRLRFDYAFTDSPTLSNTHRFSLSFLLDLFPKLLTIKNVNINPVYASLYKYFSKNPIGHAEIVYHGKENLDCTVNVKVNKYAREHTKAIFLAAPNVAKDTTLQISINTIFIDSILTEADNIPLTADIKLSYMSGNRPREATESKNFELYCRNLIDWSIDANQAAAFITPNDPAIEQFVQRALPDERVFNKYFEINKQFTKALYLFNAVSNSDIRYYSDSSTPLDMRFQGLDNIRYPSQLLKEKLGDCDDLSVFFASLFENRNIRTALIIIPGHIFLAFNTELKPRRKYQLCCADSDYFCYGNQLWLPLEITWLDSSFEAAWKKGAQEFNKSQNDRTLEFIDVHNAWNTYQPVNYASHLIKPFQPFPQHYLAQQKQNLKKSQQKYLQELERQLAQFPDSIQLRNNLAITYAFHNQLDKAANHFRIILAKDSTSFVGYNNLGNTLFLRGILDSALYYYETAESIATGEDRAGVILNQGLVFEAAGNDSIAVEMFAGVIDRLEEQKIYDLLGIDKPVNKQTGEGKPSLEKSISANTVTTLVDKAKKKPPPPRKKKKAGQSGKTGDLPKTRIEKNRVENVLFWAE